MTSEPLIRVARVVPETVAEGPGVRFAIWVQGCTIRCDGCFNPHLWKPTGGAPTSPTTLVEGAIEAGVEGITLLGGEPFEQAHGLSTLADLAQQAELSVMTFTGLVYADLRAAVDPEVHALLDATDLLVDGPYQADYPDLSRPWVGSTNQRFHFLTARYRHLEDQLGAIPDRLEVRVARTGEISVNGWSSVDRLDALVAGTASTRVMRGRVR